MPLKYYHHPDVIINNMQYLITSSFANESKYYFYVIIFTLQRVVFAQQSFRIMIINATISFPLRDDYSPYFIREEEHLFSFGIKT